LTKIVFGAIFHTTIPHCMVAPMNEKPVRKPRNVKINPDILLKARVEALRSKKTMGEWLEEAIEEKIEREEKKVK